MRLPLFPDFSEHMVQTRDGEIFVRKGGKGPALFLLHGFPQTHACWHRIAPVLAQQFTVFLPDLRGYGLSSCPPTDGNHYPYSKRAMAQDIIDVADHFGLSDFSLAGHDRGGRVAYRLALDHPARVRQLAVLDIVPTHTVWHNFTVDLAMKTYHWLFLAQPKPFPEDMIQCSGNGFIDHTLASWTASNDLSAFHPEALEEYRHYLSKPDYIHANCEDYRAGQTYDLKADEKDFDAGNKITCPLLVVWGETGIAAKGASPLDVWQLWADDVRGKSIACGHFLAEEKPDETAQALREFFNPHG